LNNNLDSQRKEQRIQPKGGGFRGEIKMEIKKAKT
jgi:hypothetical protein